MLGGGKKVCSRHKQLLHSNTVKLPKLNPKAKQTCKRAKADQMRISFAAIKPYLDYRYKKISSAWKERQK